VIVDSLMRRRVVTVPREADVRAAAQRMRDEGGGCVVVTAAGAPVGMLTERDVAFGVVAHNDADKPWPGGHGGVRVVAEGRDPAATRVADVMSSPLATIEPAATVEAAAERMRALRVKRLVVVLGHEVRGIITVTDIAYAEPMLNRSLIEGWVKSRWEG